MKNPGRTYNRVELRVTSADIWESVRVLNRNLIGVYELEKMDELTFIVQISQKDAKRCIRLLEKKGDVVHLRRTGSWAVLLRMAKKRMVLVIGLLILVVIESVLPTRILFVQVEGNDKIPTNQILEAAELSGIGFFASRAEVRSEKMKNALLSSIPDLQWAGINTYGCRAVISVQERSEAEKPTARSGVVSSIYAAEDGIVSSVTVLQGKLLCQEGQAVTRGQCLISGYTDCGLFIQATRAEGEVYAETMRNISGVFPDSRLQKTDVQRTRRFFSLCLGKKRIKLWKDSGICGGTCDKIRNEYRLTLPGGFRLPVSIICDTVSYYEAEAEPVSAEEAERLLRQQIPVYLESQMIAGTIQSKNESIENCAGFFLLKGIYSSTEMIGRERLEKNGDQYGKND